MVDDLSWGDHFCQFYQTGADLLDILVPYFKAGLEANELCVWVVSRPLRVEDAKTALKKAVPRFDEYAPKGQIEIIPFSRWCARKEKSEEAVLAAMDRAVFGGFEGLRLACNAQPEKKGGKSYACYGADAVRGCFAIAAFTYPRNRFDAAGLMEVVKNHRFALLRNADRWEVIESSEARIVKDALKRSEEKLQSLFSNMSEGFAFHRILLDPGGKPCDFVFLEANESFEKLTGLKIENLIGKRVTELIPGIENDPSDFIGRYGKVALTGEPAHFETYSQPLGKWYSVSAFSAHKGYFAVSFSDITERKLAEETVRHQNAILNGINRIFRGAITRDTEEELGRTCLSVAEELTGSKFGFIGEIGPDGLLHDIAISDTGRGLCRMDDKAGHRSPPGNFTIHGLYGRVLTDGKSLLTNDPGSHPDSIGIPEGHPPLRAFLGVPFILEGKVVGLIAVGNRDGGYTRAEMEALEALSPAIVQAFARKRAEEEVRRNREWLRVTLRSIGDAVIATDAAGLVTFLNPVASELTGWDPLEALGQPIKTVFAIFNEKTGRPAESIVERVLEEGRIVNLANHTVLVARDGRRIPIEDSAAPILDQAGRISGVVLVFHDVTEQRKAQDQVQRVARFPDENPNPVLRISSDGQLLYANRSSKPILQFLNCHPGEAVPENWRKHALRTLETGSAIEIEETFGDTIYSLILVPFSDLGYLNIYASDITERKRAEKALLKAHGELDRRVRERTSELSTAVARLELMNKELQEFAFVASHDLQEPLRKIQTFGNMLISRHRESLNTEGRDYLERTTKAANRMSELLRSLLNYSKTSTTQLHFKRVSLTRLAREAASDLEILINKAGGRVEIDELPDIEADASLLRELFQNIIENSIKYRKESEPPVVRIRGTAAGGTCRLVIEDNGIGFDMEFAPKIFKPFERLHGRNAKYNGTGMGLSICRKIAARHGGEITAESAPGAGATFIVTLPVRQSPE